MQIELSVFCIDGGTVTGLENVAGSRTLNVSQACLGGKRHYTVAFVESTLELSGALQRTHSSAYVITDRRLGALLTPV